jgi:hypothetical protein
MNIAQAFAPETWANWALAIIGMGATVAAFRTLRILKRQTKAAEDAAIAARANAETAKANTKAVINSERAWVLADNIGKLPEFTPTTNKLEILWIHVPIKNFGKTVARITRIFGLALIKKMDDPLPLPQEPEYAGPRTCDIVLPPNATYRLDVGVGTFNLTGVKQGMDTFYIYGFVDYVDLGNCTRQSRFCYIYHIPVGFNLDPEGFYPCANLSAYTKCT